MVCAPGLDPTSDDQGPSKFCTRFGLCKAYTEGDALKTKNLVKSGNYPDCLSPPHIFLKPKAKVISRFCPTTENKN